MRRWQIGALAAVLLGAAGATYGIYVWLSAPDRVALADDEQLLTVHIGDLSNNVSVNGTLVYPNRMEGTFGSQGTVGDILVEEGQRVEAGDELARLDAPAIASLQEAVARARVALQEARDALESAQAPNNALDIAETEARVSGGRVDVEKAREALDALTDPSAQDVAAAEAKVADAKLAAREAADALDALIKPPAEDVAATEAKLAAARLAAQEAGDALDALVNPPALDVSRARSSVADAKLAVQDARDAVGLLQQETPRDVARAEAAVASARLAVEEAQTALDETLSASQQTLQEADLAVTRAGLALADAREMLTNLQSLPDPEEVRRAEERASSTQQSLDNARTNLQLAESDRAARVQEAEDRVSEAQTAYADVFANWLGSTLSSDDLSRSPATILARWGADLDAIFSPAAVDRFDSPPLDDPATPWDEFQVFAWMALIPAAPQGTCENASLPRGTRCVLAELDSAWDALTTAREALDRSHADAANALTAARDAVTKAEDTFRAAKDALTDAQAPADALEIQQAQHEVDLALTTLQTAEEARAALDNPDPLVVAAKRSDLTVATANLEQAEADLASLQAARDLTIDSKRNDLAVAESALAKAQDDLESLLAGGDSLQAEDLRKRRAVAEANVAAAEEELATQLNGGDPLEVENRRKKLALAEAARTQAEESLSELRDGDPLAIDNQRQGLALAEASLAQAETDLAELRAGADPLAVALSEAQVESAQVALEDAQDRLDGATIRAPWAGVVASVNADVGDPVNRNTTVVELVDPTVVEVDGIVDEIDVLFIHEDAPAEVTMDALPGRTLQGVVSSISSASMNQQGIVSYPVRVRLTLPPGTELPEGLSAIASVVVQQESGILVPISAVYGTFDQPVVRVLSGGVIQERAVVLGNSDGFWTVVRDGLSEGEQVVMQHQQSGTTRPGGAGAIFRQFRGGGFGGGGFDGRRGGAGGRQGPRR